ncbi:MAG: hypothetical protein EOP24_43335 [Hyphomicrobiales bacterium]|nr:MAG: hypothetical protein EOP24_43335 [Hyphomicrobiales bacterium]
MIQHPTPVFDADADQASAAATGRASEMRPKRKRGRPPGSRTRIAHEHVSSDEFALLRAVAQGVDLSVASRQYLHWPGRMPERAGLERYYMELLGRIKAAAESLPDAPQALAMLGVLRSGQILQLEAATSHSAPEVIREVLPEAVRASPIGGRNAGQETALSARPLPESVAPLPSLEDFAAQFDEDMYSQAELEVLYAEAYPSSEDDIGGVAGDPVVDDTELQAGLDLSGVPEVVIAPWERLRPAGSSAERIAEQLQAIDWLDSRLGMRPDRNHRVEQWVRFSDAQRQALQDVGVVTLGNLIDWMSLRGHKWVEDLPGYGRKRGESLLTWLQRSALVPGAGLPAMPSVALSMPEASELQPLKEFRWPTALNGRDGKFRTPLANTMDVDNDPEAIAAWFDVIGAKSPHTQEAYQRAIERLVLWAIVERRKALSSLDERDMAAFKQFLIHPPAHWVQEPKKKGLRQAPGWRPLRGPLNNQSLLVTFSAVSSMFSHWRASSYTYVNAAEKLKGKRSEELEMDVFRSFTKADLQVIGNTFADLPEGPAKRRLRAILLILENGGLRRAELASAYWSDLKSDRVDGERTSERVLHVKGKGKRERKVPLNAKVLQALEEHRADRIRLMQERDSKREKAGMFSQVKLEEMPLIGVLDDKWLFGKDRVAKEEAMARTKASATAIRPTMEVATVSPIGRWQQVTTSSTSPVVYQSIRKGALSGKMIYQLLKEFFEQCSVVAGEDPRDTDAPFKRASTHWMRHTFAHKMLAIQTMEPAKLLPLVQALMGHKSINTTAIYLKADMSDRIRAVDQLKGSV